jgi:hypothetical protein
VSDSYAAQASVVSIGVKQTYKFQVPDELYDHRDLTVVSEILVPRVCGGLKIAQIQKIQKMLFCFKLPLSTFKRLQTLWNELSEIWVGRLAIISGGFGPQSMIEGLLITQHTLHVGGDPALSYTILVESTKQLGLLGHVDRFAGAG